MMKKIWKVTYEDFKPLLMPEDADIISIGKQANRLVLWFKTSGNSPEKITDRILIVPTGEEVNDDLKFYGTFVSDEGLAYHIFDKYKTRFHG